MNKNNYTDILESAIKEIDSNNELIRLLLPKQTYDKDKWKYICFEILEQIKLKQYKDMISIYRNDMGKFAEDMLGVKLTWYQKALLKLKRETFNPIILRRNTNYYQYCNMIRNILKGKI